MDDKEQKTKDLLLRKLRKVMKKGDKKSSTFAAEEALKFYKRSLDNLEKQPETPENITNQVEMRLLLGEILYILGKWDPALSYLRKVQDMGVEKAGMTNVAEAFRKSGNLWALKGDIDQTFEDFRKALDISKRAKDQIGIADSERGLGYAYWRRGNIQEAETHYSAAFKALQKAKDEDLLAKTYLESGNVYNDKGDLDKAVEYYMKAIRVFRKTQDLYQEARAYNNLGDVCIKRKDWKKGIRYFQKTAGLADSINDLHMQGWALFNAAECQAKDGNLDEAEECCTKALDMLSRIDDKIGIAYVFCNYGIVYRFKKEWAKSTKYFKFSLNIVKNLQTPGLEAYVLKEYAEMLNDWGKKDKAKEQTIEAMKIYSGMGAKYYIEEMNELLARIEGRDYKMSITVSAQTQETVDKESESPEVEVTPKVQVPIVVEDLQSTKKKEAAVSDDGYVEVDEKKISPRPPVLASERGVAERTAPGIGSQATEPEADVEDGPKVPDMSEVPDEATKLLLFLPKDEDDTIRRQKVRFFVELPFIATDIEVDEIREGEYPEIAARCGVSEYPCLVIYDRVFPGIPSAKDLSDILRESKGKRPGAKKPLSSPQRAKVEARPAIPTTQEPRVQAASRVQRPEQPKAESGPVKFHYSYIVEEEGHERAFKLFKEMLDQGAKGLCLTRPPARKLSDQFGLEGVDFILFSTQDSPRSGMYPLKELDDITHQIEIFMESQGTTVVLLDRTETILEHIGFDRYLRMVHTLNECLDSCKSCIIVPIDPHLIGNVEMRTLRRELTPI